MIIPKFCMRHDSCITIAYASICPYLITIKHVKGTKTKRIYRSWNGSRLNLAESTYLSVTKFVKYYELSYHIERITFNFQPKTAKLSNEYCIVVCLKGIISHHFAWVSFRIQTHDNCIRSFYYCRQSTENAIKIPRGSFHSHPIHGKGNCYMCHKSNTGTRHFRESFMETPSSKCLWWMLMSGKKTDEESIEQGFNETRYFPEKLEDHSYAWLYLLSVLKIFFIHRGLDQHQTT